MSKITADYILQQADAEEGPGCCDPEWERMSQVMRAAPDLLEALESLHNRVLGNTGMYGNYYLSPDFIAAESAIARAKGEQA